MTLFCVAIRRDSVFPIRFPICSHVQVFSCEFSLVFRLKYPYFCFPSYSCFQADVVQLILVVFVLFLVNEISLSLFCFLYSLRNVVSALSSVLISPLTLFFLDTYKLSLSSLGCKTLCINMSFLVLWPICWSFSFIHFKYLTRGTGKMFISLMRLLLWSLVSSSFLFLLRYTFLTFF